MTTLVIDLPDPYDFWGSTRSVGPVVAWEGRSVLWWATTTPAGAATLRLAQVAAGQVHADAWGDGAEWMLGQARRVLGLDDDPSAFAPPSGFVGDLARRAVGLHLPRTDRVHEALVTAILGQKVQSDAARQSLRQPSLRFGARAPGPRELHLVPTANVLASLDYVAFHPCNVERARAERVLAVSRRAAWAESRTACVTMGEPTVRLFVNTPQALGATLTITTTVRNPTTGVSLTTAYVVAGGVTPTGWAPTPQIVIPNLLGGFLDEELTVRITTGGTPADWGIDDVYVDPYKQR